MLPVFALLPACTSSGNSGDSASGTSSDTADTGTDDTGGPDAGDHLDLGDFHPRNAVIIEIDALRADALTPWGSLHDTMPLVTGRPGWISVERAISTASWTGPSTASVLTGVDPLRHGVRTFDETNFANNSPIAVDTLAADLSAAGFTTAVVSGNNVLVGDPYDMSKDFTLSRYVPDETGNSTSVVPAAIEVLDDIPHDAPFLLFLQPMDAHEPFNPASADVGTWSDPDAIPFDLASGAQDQATQIDAALAAAADGPDRDALIAQIRDVYDEQLLEADRQIDGLLTALDEQGRLDDTLVVITGDHGESIFEGDPQVFGHGRNLRQEQIHVPLMFGNASLPDTHLDCLASGMDVLTTVVDALGVPLRDDLDGQSLLRGCRDVAVSSLYALDGDRETLAFLSAESLDGQVMWDCHDQITQAWDLLADPLARQPLSVDEVPAAAALEDTLTSYEADVEEALPGLACDVTP